VHDLAGERQRPQVMLIPNQSSTAAPAPGSNPRGTNRPTSTVPKRTNAFSASVHVASLATRLARPRVGGSRLELIGEPAARRVTSKTQGYALPRLGSSAAHLWAALLLCLRHGAFGEAKRRVGFNLEHAFLGDAQS